MLLLLLLLIMLQCLLQLQLQILPLDHIHPRFVLVATQNANTAPRTAAAAHRAACTCRSFHFRQHVTPCLGCVMRGVGQRFRSLRKHRSCSAVGAPVVSEEQRVECTHGE